MPELPEVETISRDLDEIVSGHIIKEVLVAESKIVASPPEEFPKLLTGAKIVSVKRLGKWVQFHLAGGKVPGEKALLAHLKMTGQFIMGPWPQKADDWPPHTRAAFRLSDFPDGGDTLFYRDIRKFGRLRAFDQADLSAFLTELAQGPDALAIDVKDFFQRVSGKGARLKGVLLDQSVVAGLGNIYVDEGLFAAKLSPLKVAKTVTEAEAARLLKELKRILTASIKDRGSTTSNYQGLKGGGCYQGKHKVYGHTGDPCPVCGAAIQNTTVAGRSTHFCPNCQGQGVAAGQ